MKTAHKEERFLLFWFSFGDFGLRLVPQLRACGEQYITKLSSSSGGQLGKRRYCILLQRAWSSREEPRSGRRRELPCKGRGLIAGVPWAGPRYHFRFVSPRVNQRAHGYSGVSRDGWPDWRHGDRGATECKMAVLWRARRQAESCAG